MVVVVVFVVDVAVDVVFVVVVNVEISCLCWLRVHAGGGRGAHLGVAKGATRPRGVQNSAAAMVGAVVGTWRLKRLQEKEAQQVCFAS